MAGRRRQVVERALRRGGEAELLALGIRFRESFLEVDTFRRPWPTRVRDSVVLAADGACSRAAGP